MDLVQQTVNDLKGLLHNKSEKESNLDNYLLAKGHGQEFVDAVKAAMLNTPGLNLLDILCSDDNYRPNEIVLEERDNALTCMYSPARLNDILGTASVIQDKLFKLQLLLNRA